MVTRLQMTSKFCAKLRNVTGSKRGKTCNRYQPRENLQPVPSAGKLATGVPRAGKIATGTKRGKAWNRYQARKTCNRRTKRGKNCNRYQTRENLQPAYQAREKLQPVPNAGKLATGVPTAGKVVTGAMSAGKLATGTNCLTSQLPPVSNKRAVNARVFAAHGTNNFATSKSYKKQTPV